MSLRRSEALNAAEEIARAAGLPIERVWTYFAFFGRLSDADQWKLTRADVAVLGFITTKKKRKLQANLMLLADHYFAERGVEGAFALTRDAA